jgi:signal transduction histidine kinase
MKLTLKLVLTIVLGITVVLSIYAALRVQREIELFESDLRRDLKGLGHAAAVSMQRTWADDGEDAALQMLDSIRARESHYDLRWIPAASLNSELADVENLPLTMRELAEGEDFVESFGEQSAEKHLVVVTVPVRVRERVQHVDVPGEPPHIVNTPRRLVGAIEIQGTFVDQQGYIAQSLTRSIIATVTTLLACAGLLFGFGVWLIQRPVQRLIEAAHRIGAGDLSPTDLPVHSDEIGALALAMDGMRESLSQARARVESEVRARVEADVRAETERNERLLLVEQLRHADRLATVGKLASSIAHELGSPLQVVGGRARMIERALTGNVDDKSVRAVENAKTVREQAERITVMMRQLLDFSRKKGAATDVVLLKDAVDKTLALVIPMAEHAKIETRVDVSDPTLAVRIEPGQLQQVLMNLAMNAIHAMPDGGTLSVQATRDDDGVLLCVQDTGTGMSEETQKKLFTPFFTTKPPGQGTGLGLTVVEGIVHEAGGRLRVQSELGHGSRFFIHLPGVSA